MAKVKQKPNSIVDLATEDSSFTTLVEAIKSADLIGTLKGNGPFTVFAPTNAAFEKLPKGTVKSLFKATNKSQLQNILKHHVVQGRKMAADVAGMSSLTMMSGETVPIRKKGNVVSVGDASIRRTNLEANNGVVHAIDSVLMPSEED
ncbi:hypothetical protein BSZ35_03860 [Salinibacter sp. 10B]|uniref:fasciclin domain-containing protein n=1 Tax=Salinibacter sp. 10B TaxID=1923971 RepID=UPI000CF3A72C|nr:fasciclin domain-containing protein [Salinibacter sp. 10B]PQJ33854.1 hypothetical protein BSZ35_03860 [Salinibacter sp. 10B]